MLRRDRQEWAAEPPAPVETPRAGLSGVLPAVTGDSRTPAQPGLQFCQKSVFSEAEGAQVQFGPSGLWFAPLPPPPPHTDLTQTPSVSCAGDTEQPCPPHQTPQPHIQPLLTPLVLQQSQVWPLRAHILIYFTAFPLRTHTSFPHTHCAGFLLS